MLAVITSQWWILLLLGIAAGTVGGLLGVGGGIVMVPIMVLILALPQKAAQGVSLTVMVPLALVAAARYWMGSNMMDVAGLSRSAVFTLAVLVAVGAVAGSLVGTHFAGRLENNTLRIVFALFMILVGIYMLLPKPWEAKKTVEKPAATSTSTPGEPANGPAQ